MSQAFEVNRQRGAILVVSLIITLVMTTMGVGLFYTADQNIQQIEAHTDRSETLYSAETCIDEAVQWLEVQAEIAMPCIALPSGDVCHVIGGGGSQKTMDSAWREVEESSSARQEKVRARMAEQQYTCKITLTATLPALGPKYLYKIESEGMGPKNVRTDIEVIASITAGGSSDGGNDVGQANEY